MDYLSFLSSGVFIMIVLFFSFICFVISKGNQYWDEIIEDVDTRPLEITKTWDVESASYVYGLFKYEVNFPEYDCPIIRVEQGKGDIKWAKKQSEHYKIAIQDEV